MGTPLFDQLIGDVPPSSVDVAAIVRREKRRSTARRVTGVATAVVALSVTTAIGLTMTSGTGTSSPPSVAGGSAPAGGGTPDTRFVLVANNEESAAASANRLGAALDAAFRKVAPGARWIFNPEVPGQTGPDDQPPKLSYVVLDGSAKKSQELFHGDSGVLNEGRKGSLRLGVNAVDGVGEDGTPQRKAGTCPPSGAECEAGTAPNGAPTVVLSKAFDNKVRVYTAEVALPDGRALRITVNNNYGAGGDGAPRQATPLTSTQALAIAVDVASHIKA